MSWPRREPRYAGSRHWPVTVHRPSLKTSQRGKCSVEPSSVFQLLSPGKVPKNPIETRLEATPVKPWCRVLNFITFGTGCVQKRIHVDVCVFCKRYVRVGEFIIAFFVIFLDYFWVCSFSGLWYWLKVTWCQWHSTAGIFQIKHLGLSFSRFRHFPYCVLYFPNCS